MNLDSSLLRAALIGYESELAKIQLAIDDLRRRLNQTPSDGKAATATRRRPRLSAAARKRIAAAQKKRWAAYKKAKAAKK